MDSLGAAGQFGAASQMAVQQGRSYSSGGMVGGTFSNTVTAAPAPPATLVSVMQLADELNARLSDLTSRAHKLASAVGGPFPMGGDEAKAQGGQQPAIERLGDTLKATHHRANDLQSCIDAMSRTLGA